MAAALALGLAATIFAADESPVDFRKAREIYERQQRGERLTDEERAYVQRAKQAQRSGKRDAAGQAQKANALPPPPAPWSQHLTPLDELGDGSYKGQDGGLYGGGRNEPPAEHGAAARREAERIRPLDAQGRPAAGGKIGLISVGMSNTTQEFSRFMALARGDKAIAPSIVLVDSAQGGQTATRWADPAAPLWKTVEERIAAAGLSPQQIQVAWMKQAEAGPARLGDFPRHAEVLRDHLVMVLAHLKTRFPNLRIVYLSSRIYGGYAKTALNPEPYAYEAAFSMRWLIRDQIAGKPELNYDAARGPVKAPLLLWGPYLWADGATPRKAGGLSYAPEDFARDGTHPSDSGRAKVAAALLAFLKTEPTSRPWFLRDAGAPARSGG